MDPIHSLPAGQPVFTGQSLPLPSVLPSWQPALAQLPVGWPWHELHSVFHSVQATGRTCSGSVVPSLWQ